MLTIERSLRGQLKITRFVDGSWFTVECDPTDVRNMTPPQILNEARALANQFLIATDPPLVQVEVVADAHALTRAGLVR